MAGDDDEVEGPVPVPAGSSTEAAAAALRLDLDDDEFADLALPDEESEPEPAASESGDALELDDLDVEELPVEVAVPTLYLELDGRFWAVEKERFILGRVSTMCDLAIRDVNVSRQHCAIERRADGYYAVDLGSINGIVIDGKKTDNHRIEEGDVLVLSGHEIAASFHEPVLTARSLEPEPDYPLTTGEFPPVPQAVAEPEPEPEPEPISAPTRPEPAIAAAIPVQQVSHSFEERVEQRLDYIAQQLAYLQQSLNALYVRVEQLQGVAHLADLIQGRLANKRQP